MISNAEKILVKGLKSGYAGGEKPHAVSRGPFTLKATELSFPDFQAIYNDHWIFKRVGGGQEIAQSGSEMATRVFAGGVVNPDILSTLGVTHEQVLSYHKKVLSQFADNTRLHEEVVSQQDGDWQYRYTIMKDYPDLPLTVGVETITYKNHEVFIHVFLNTPIV